MISEQRVIKFRAWVKGGFMGEPFNPFDPEFLETGGTFADGTIFMQFAEETYSDGTDVYEGDIYEYDYEYDSDYDGDMPIVKHSKGRGVVYSIYNTRQIRTAKSEGGTVKKIGTIYETPNLLTP